MTDKNIKKIKLIVIVKSIDGGTGTFLLNFLNLEKLTKKKIQIKTLILEKPTFRKVKNNSFTYFRKKDFYPQVYTFSPLNFVHFMQEFVWIKNQLSSFNPKVILAVDLRCNLLAIALRSLSLNRLKVITTTHTDLGRVLNSKSTPTTKSFLRILIKTFYQKANAIVAVSNKLSASLKEEFAINNTKTIYNGIKIKHYKPKPFPDKRKNIYITTLGRLFEQKDTKNLILAFDFHQKRLSNTTLHIVGDGPDKKELIKFTKKIKLNNKVKFHGWVDNPKKILKKSNLFVLSSHREGFGFVLIEAMHLGIPIMSTNTPHGPSEILSNGKYGILVPMRSPDKLGNAMLKVLTNRKLYEYYAKQSIKRSRYFSETKMLNSYAKIIHDLSY
jgi:glycosyltransferase involved in cell wall biosynthesis